MKKTRVAAKPKYLIGIDEVGRGPIAGPVAVCAYAIAAQHAKKITIAGARDSKQMTAHAREASSARLHELREQGIGAFSIAMVSAKAIDSKGIVPAIRKALETALGEVMEMVGAQPADVRVSLDGGLRAPAEFTSQETVIKGDSKIAVISAASVLAKVHRDAHMTKLAKKYSEYGFETHKGYGTRAHYMAITKHGLTPLHRTSFLKGLSVKGRSSLKKKS